MGWRNYENYPKSTPIRKEGGIKANDGRKLGGERWWAKRWVAVLDSFDLGARLTRGRSYARRGQVLAIEISPGVVAAKVQGSSAKPYQVTIALAPLSPQAWERVINDLTGRAIFLAKLLAGEMPAEIEELFQTAGTPLFPTASRDLTTNCSCPDWSNPCKHIAAAYYLLGEEFDRDPFLIFTLRGLPREELLARLHTLSGNIAQPAPTHDITPEPLATDPATFWSGKPDSDNADDDARPSAINAPLLRRLGNFPFWRGAEPILTALSPDYADAEQRGRDCYLCLAASEQYIPVNQNGE